MLDLTAPASRPPAWLAEQDVNLDRFLDGEETLFTTVATTGCHVFARHRAEETMDVFDLRVDVFDLRVDVFDLRAKVTGSEGRGATLIERHRGLLWLTGRDVLRVMKLWTQTIVAPVISAFLLSASRPALIRPRPGSRRCPRAGRPDPLREAVASA